MNSSSHDPPVSAQPSRVDGRHASLALLGVLLAMAYVVVDGTLRPSQAAGTVGELVKLHLPEDTAEPKRPRRNAAARLLRPDVYKPIDAVAGRALNPDSFAFVERPGVDAVRPRVGMVSRGPTEGGLYELEGADSVVYLVDASGSMVDSFAGVLREVREAVRRLEADQSFVVLFFQAGRVFDPAGRGLQRATPRAKGEALAGLDPERCAVRPRGRSDATPAIREALGFHPDLIVLTSDSILPRGATLADQAALLRQWERDRQRLSPHTRISTVQFIYQDPIVRTRGGVNTLRLLAGRSGGEHRFVRGLEGGW